MKLYLKQDLHLSTFNFVNVSKSKYITNLKAINFVSHIQCFKKPQSDGTKHTQFKELFYVPLLHMI